MDRQAAASLDRWITRDPPYDDGERPLLKCSGCGRFLVEKPLGTRDWVIVEHCNGQPHVVENIYGSLAGDEAILAIIGGEHRGETYRVAFPPACGSMKGSTHMTHDGEISPEDAAKWEHAAHWFVPDWGDQQVALRYCWCGQLNEEVLS